MLDQTVTVATSASVTVVERTTGKGAVNGNTAAAARITRGKAPPGGGKTSPVQGSSVSKLYLERVAQQLNVAAKSIGRTLNFQVDVVNGSSVIQVLDRDTGELIREIPPDKAHSLLQNTATPELQLLDKLV